MKVAITADTQFDQQLNYATMDQTGISSRLRDSVACFNWIVDTAVKRDCERLFVIGDIFDSRTSIDLSVLHEVCRAFYLASAKLDLTVVVGNHDSYLRSPAINSAQVFNGCATVVDCLTIDGPFAFVPWFEDDAVFAANLADAAQSDAEYLFTHCIVEGAVPNISKPRPISLLQPERWRGVFLGDVHEPVVLTERVRYCGSPMQHHFGDAGGRRGFLVLDTDTAAVEFVTNTVSPRFHLLDAVPKPGLVRDCDYVRIQHEDAGVTEEIVRAIKSKPVRIERRAVEVKESKQRIGVTINDAREEALRKYVEHKGLSGSEELVKLGLAILDEASHEG